MTDRDFVHRGFGGALRPGDIAPLVVLAADRETVRSLTAAWTDARRVADHYAFEVWAGRVGEVALAACSTGTGSPGAAIAIEELAGLGARTLVGIGATRAPLGDGPVGRIIIADGAVRGDTASAGYAREGVPATPDVEVVLAAEVAARGTGVVIVHDVVADLDAAAHATGGRLAAGAPRSRAIAATIRATGAIPVDGSPATLLVIGAIHGLRTGFIGADPWRPDGTPDPEGLRHAAMIATTTLLTLDAWDRGRDGVPTSFAERMAAMPPQGGHRTQPTGS